MDYVDLNAGHVDCAIRFGHGHWAEASVRPLLSDSLVLVAAPQLLDPRQLPPLQSIMKLPLLHSVESWAAWTQSIPQVNPQWQRPAARMEFTDSTHLLEAAKLGLGVALTRRTIADHLLSRGELIQAHPHECQHASHYYALLPKLTPVKPSTEHFLSWLQVECQRFAQQHAIQVVP